MTSSNKYEKNVYLAMLAEQCNRFDEMVEFLEDMLKARDKDLSNDERNLISMAYKNSVTSRRTALRSIIAYESKEIKKEKSNFLLYMQEYRKRVEDELTKICNNVINVCDSHLLKKAENEEATVFYLKMKADYNRYIAEYAKGELKQKVTDSALNAYKEANEQAKNLSTINPVTLGLALNFSVFYYEVMNDHETACKIAKDTLYNANKELPNIDDADECHQDSVSIINLITENLELWQIECEDDDSNVNF